MKYAASILASALLFTAPAMAADLGWGGAPASNTANLFSPTSAFNWSGFYAGLNGGYGWGTVSRTPTIGGATTESNSGGWVLGGQAGYNVDLGGFVIGGEADLQWSSIGISEDLGPGAGTLDTTIDGFATVRGRAGASFGQVMPYFTGGFAIARGTVSQTDGAGVVTSQSNNHMGWVLGGGLEAAATENLTLKAEYLHFNLGEQTYTTAPGGDVDVGHSFGIIRAGINYKF
jgi:outer membrane immunogenic protein